MLAEIIKLKNEGKSLQNISDLLGISIGKIRYQWNKFQNHKNDVTANSVYPRFSYQDEDLEGFSAGKLSLVLVSKDRVFCQWELQEWFVRAMGELFDPIADFQIYDLRLYDVTDILFNGNNAHHTYCFKVPASSRHWFIKGLKRNRSYVCELGFFTCHHEFFPLLRSHPIHTPYERPDQYQTMFPAMEKFKNQETERPLWVEHASTYTYYEHSLEEKYE